MNNNTNNSTQINLPTGFIELTVKTNTGDKTNVYLNCKTIAYIEQPREDSAVCEIHCSDDSDIIAYAPAAGVLLKAAENLSSTFITVTRNKPGKEGHDNVIYFNVSFIESLSVRKDGRTQIGLMFQNGGIAVHESIAELINKMSYATALTEAE